MNHPELDPDNASQPIKYTSVGLVSDLTPYNTFQHPSLCLSRGGYVGAAQTGVVSPVGGDQAPRYHVGSPLESGVSPARIGPSNACHRAAP